LTEKTDICSLDYLKYQKSDLKRRRNASTKYCNFNVILLSAFINTGSFSGKAKNHFRDE